VGSACTTDDASIGSSPVSTVGWSGQSEIVDTPVEGLPRCTKGMESRLLAFETTNADAQGGQLKPPGGAEAGYYADNDPPLSALHLRPGPSPSEFDWDQNGEPDQLVLDASAGLVTLDWGDGALSIAGIEVDITSDLEDANGRLHGHLDPGVSATVRPVAVADFTGDGWLDLAVANGGAVAVLAGAGAATPTGTLDFTALGVETLGWHHRPSRVLDGDDKPVPRSAVEPVWDVDGDDVIDLRVVEPTSVGFRPPSYITATYLSGARCSTTPLAGSTTTTTLVEVPDDPCAAPPYLLDERQAAVPPERIMATLADVVYEHPLVSYGDLAFPPSSRTRRTFDWDHDGVADRVEVDPLGRAITIRFGSGTVRVRGVRTDFTGEHPYSLIRYAYPLDIGDVTGDGDQDLLITSEGRLAVLVGDGARQRDVDIAFDEIGKAVPGWITEPKVAPGQPARPSQFAEPRVINDFNLDGIQDIGVYSHGSRSNGSFDYTIGRPCKPQG
jgi:hypothetical protein